MAGKRRHYFANIKPGRARMRMLLPFTPPANRSPFLEIPVELRMDIFSYILVKSYPLIIGYNTDDIPRGRMREEDEVVEKATMHCPRKHTESIDLRLARVSKQICEEVGAVVYGKNTFAFLQLSNLQDFKLQTANWFPLLQHVELRHKFFYDRTPDHWLTILSLFKECTDLVTITLPHNEACPELRKGISKFATTREDAIELGQAIREQLSTLKQHRENKEGEQNALQIIKIAKSYFTCKHYSGSGDHYVELTAQINSLLARYFDRGDEGFAEFQQLVQVIEPRAESM